jgi:hypothetical protein
MIVSQRETTPFSHIKVSGSVPVAIECSTDQRVLVKGPHAKALDRIVTTVNDGVLSIEVVGSDLVGTIPVITPSKSLLQSLLGFFAGKEDPIHKEEPVTLENITIAINTNELKTISVEGSAKVTLSGIKQDELHIALEGSAILHAEGVAGKVTATVDGSGSLKAFELKTLSLFANVRGSGRLEATVAEVVKATASGSGSILIAGNPCSRKLSKEGSGSASLV